VRCRVRFGRLLLPCHHITIPTEQMEQAGVPAVIACTTPDDKKVELRLEPTGLVLSGAVKAELPFQYIATYECSRVKDVGPQWELKIAFVSWRMYLFGKTVTNHVLRLTVLEVSACCVGRALATLTGWPSRSIRAKRIRIWHSRNDW
jgi:hypothetical protein